MNFLTNSQINILIDIAIKAGDIASAGFGNSNLKITTKSDNSQVTEIDIKISQFIEKNLKQHFPNIEIICEEGSNRIVSQDCFWLIDPIDGTNSFIDNDPEFTVNIALIKNRRPIFGVIYAPEIEGAPLFYNDENNRLIKFLVKKNHKIIIENKSPAKNKFTIITSKRTSDDQVKKYVENNLPKINPENLKILKVSSSLKFCYLAQNEADLYLHLRKSMEWDIAAGHALIMALGGSVYNLDGNEINYQKNGFVNSAFIAKIK